MGTGRGGGATVRAAGTATAGPPTRGGSSGGSDGRPSAAEQRVAARRREPARSEAGARQAADVAVTVDPIGSAGRGRAGGRRPRATRLAAAEQPTRTLAGGEASCEPTCIGCSLARLLLALRATC